MLQILIIEDIPSFQRRLCESILEIDPSAKIIVANNLNSARTVLSEVVFRLIILDGKLEAPGPGQGHTRNLLSAMTEEQKKVTVINSNDDDFLLEAKEKHGTQYLSRKNNEEELKKILTSILG
jgi:response regulator of citrate/malate metabolism